MFRKTLLLSTLVVSMAWTAPAAADPILFDPDGLGGNAPFTITLLDWAPGNALAVGANANSTASPQTDFTLYYQASLGVAKNGSTNVFAPGLGNTNFFTAVAGFGESVVGNDFNAGTGVGTLTFALDPLNPVNFFRIYTNSVQADDLSGVCFVCGTLVMSGHIESYLSPSTFSTTGFGGNLDQNPPDNYPAIDTLNGSGAVNIRVKVDSYDDDYFPSMGPGVFIDFATADTSTILPFTGMDPSRCIHSTAFVAGACVGGMDGATVGSLGTVNGFNGNNTLLKADANASFTNGVIPEPASLTLLGIGLAGAAAARRRKKAAKK